MRAPAQWSRSEAAAFTLALSVLPTGRAGSAGLDYETVADMCEALGRPRPSQLGEERRLLLIGWLLTPPGRRTYELASASRAQLLEAAREYSRKTLQLAAMSAGLIDPKTGKPRSAPAQLSGRELWLLLSAIPLPGRVDEHPPGRQKCCDCGLLLTDLRPRCPCGSVLLERLPDSRRAA